MQADILGHWGSEARFDSVRSPIYSLEELRWLATRPEVRVLVTGEAPPYSFYDDEGNYRGLIADLLAEVSQRSGVRFRMVDISSVGSAIQHLQDGKAGLATVLLPTPE